MKLYTFVMNNHNKKLSLQALVLSALYRFCILVLPKKKLETFMGSKGEESELIESEEIYKKIGRIGYVVNRICNQTPWESKCLVKALTAQRLLKRRKIPSTLYLGVGKKDDRDMIAHAWLRCGEYYVTGGNGTGYTVVAKFRA